MKVAGGEVENGILNGELPFVTQIITDFPD